MGNKKSSLPQEDQLGPPVRLSNPSCRGTKTQNFPDEVRQTVSHDKPKKRAFASHDIAKERVMNVLGPTPPTESQQISPNRAKNGVGVLNKTHGKLCRSL